MGQGSAEPTASPSNSHHQCSSEGGDVGFKHLVLPHAVGVEDLPATTPRDEIVLNLVDGLRMLQGKFKPKSVHGLGSDDRDGRSGGSGSRGSVSAERVVWKMPRRSPSKSVRKAKTLPTIIEDPSAMTNVFRAPDIRQRLLWASKPGRRSLASPHPSNYHEQPSWMNRAASKLVHGCVSGSPCPVWDDRRFFEIIKDVS